MKHIHHWILDNKDYGKCECGAEKDFQEKEKIGKYRWIPKTGRLETEFYNQSKLKIGRDRL